MPLNDLMWHEDMSPAEMATMMKMGGHGLAGVRQAAQMGGGAAPLMMTQRPPSHDPVGRGSDYVSNLLSLFGTPMAGGVKANPMLQRRAPATFFGRQEGYGKTPGFDMYNLTKDVAGHPAGSTVGAKTLLDLGYRLPRR